jgi:hypothetical protein
MAPSLLYLLPHPPSEVPLVEEAHRRAATTAARLHLREVNLLETEPLVNNAFLMANGDEARECPSTLAQVEVVAVLNVSAVEEETDLTEPSNKTPNPSTPPPSAINLVSSILGLA